ncbi:Uncharacterized protein Fot_44922 [Forsythia ovata]|uniref:Uncharacterized protein n=1 Tax=Forsythia ovata TaxID=205694 RepID=A0ABD1R506_9LAMI
MAKKDGELGVLNAKNFRDSENGKQIFEDGKQAVETELLELIKDELPNINFDFLYEEGETAALALPSEVDNNEAIVELTSSEIVPTSNVVVEPTNGTFPSQASAKPTSFEAVLGPTARTLPTQAADTTIFENLQDL